MYYALQVGGGGGIKGRGDTRGLMRVLPILQNCQAHRAFEDPFLHTLVIITYDILHIKGFCNSSYAIFVTNFSMNYRFRY